jgi:hypothetical protein
VATNPDAISADPVFCYVGQAREIERLQRELFMLTALRECSTAQQITLDGVERNAPVFFVVDGHPRPVPDSFWPRLNALGATIVHIQIARPTDLQSADAAHQT